MRTFDESQGRDPHGVESPALNSTRYFCDRGLEQPAAAMHQLLLVIHPKQARDRR